MTTIHKFNEGDTIEKVCLTIAKRELQAIFNVDNIAVQYKRDSGYNIAQHIQTHTIKLCAVLYEHTFESEEIHWEVKVPKTWWQHFKLSHMPDWFIKKYPVQYETITKHFKMDYKALFPKAPVISSLGPRFIVARKAKDIAGF